MKIIRFSTTKYPDNYGWLLDNEIGLIEGEIFSEYRRLETVLSLDRVTILPPVVPSKIICIARNYVDHARERNAEIPETPMIFLKPPSAIIQPGVPIRIPPQSTQVEHEAELAIVIGKEGRWIDPQDAHAYIFGFTIANDVTARDLQQTESQWTRAKGFDTFCPLGPWIETELDTTDLLITCKVNGELRQMASTKEMIFPVPQIVSFVSNIMTLVPGDVILTGTPAGVGILEPGDKVDITIEGIGSLSNPVN
ncbi:MAG: fumarylacetoacetate hydrolase family protein [Anaerolineaceae bacterium]|nr:fumarylacetoacetate hydrolase family protein [Anaerolineaceae bacterium]